MCIHICYTISRNRKGRQSASVTSTRRPAQVSRHLHNGEPRTVVPVYPCLPLIARGKGAVSTAGLFGIGISPGAVWADCLHGAFLISKSKGGIQSCLTNCPDPQPSSDAPPSFLTRRPVRWSRCALGCSVTWSLKLSAVTD